MINPEILREYDIRGIYKKSLTIDDISEIAKKLSKILKEGGFNHIKVTYKTATNMVIQAKV